MDSRATQPVSPISPPPPAQPTVDVGGFEVLTRLGEGGMGQVYKARQKSIDRLVALKVLTPKLAQDKDYVERFEREAKAAGKLVHPNIVGVIDRGEHRSGPTPVRWIAFEYVDGSSLESRIKKGRLPEREALKVVRDIGEALAYASKQGLIHRDVKPDNILLTSDGTPKLADLGLAKFQKDDTSLTQTGIVMGTPHYMAPEQALGEKDLDIRADIYALGLVFYRCLTGEVPFIGDTALAILTRHINHDCPDPRERVPEISEGSFQLLRGMTARDKSVRFKPDEVVQTANALLAKLATQASGVSRPMPLTQQSSRVDPGAAVTGAASPPTTAASRVPSTAGAKAASSGRPRPPSGVVNTTVTAATARTTSARAVPKKEPDVERESRLPLVILVGLFAALAGGGALLVLKKGPPPVPSDDVVANVTSDKKADSPPDEKDEPRPVEVTPADPSKEPKPDVQQTPADVVLPPPEPDPGLTPEQLATLAVLVRKVSKDAIEAPDFARDEVDQAIKDYPAATPPLEHARHLVDFVDAGRRTLNDPKLTTDALRTTWAKARADLKKEADVDTSTALGRAVKDEATAWVRALDATFALDGFMRATSSTPPSAIPFPKPGSGCVDAVGSYWSAFAKDLELALRAFETRQWDASKKHAASVLAALAGKDGEKTPANMFGGVLETARTLTALADRIALHKQPFTALDAFESLRDTKDLKPSPLQHRWLVYDCVKTLPTSPFLPDGNRGFSATGKGLAAPNVSLERKGPGVRPAELDRVNAQWLLLGTPDAIQEVRFNVQRETSSVQYLSLNSASKGKNFPPMVFLSPDRIAHFTFVKPERLGDTHNVKELTAAVSAVEYPGKGANDVETFYFALVSDGTAELHLVANGHDVGREKALKLDDRIAFHATHLTVTRASWLIRAPRPN